MGLIVENLNPGTSDEYLTPPEAEAEANTEEVEAHCKVSSTVLWKRLKDTP